MATIRVNTGVTLVIEVPDDKDYWYGDYADEKARELAFQLYGESYVNDAYFELEEEDLDQ